MTEQKNKEAIHVRDFLYLDVERVKSIFAQLEEGLVTGKERVGGTSKEASGNVGGGIPALLSLAAEGKFIWENEERETKTLHDYIFHHVESKMCNRGLVTFIDGSTFPSQGLVSGVLQHIGESSFLLIRGRIDLDDYDYLKGIFENFNELSKFIYRSSMSQQFQQCQDLQARQQLEKELDELVAKNTPEDWIVKGLQRFFDVFYKGRCMVTVYPDKWSSSVYFTGHLIKAFIRDGLESVIFRYGTSPQIYWNLFAQVAYIPSDGKSDLNNLV